MEITPIDRELAQVSSIAWTEADAERQAEAIVKLLPDAATSWDGGDEDWIQLLSGAVVVCYIHVKRPLVMLVIEFEPHLSEAFDDRVVVLAVSSWTDKSLSADLMVLRRAFPGYVLPDALPGRSVGAFSAEELWFATN